MYKIRSEVKLHQKEEYKTVYRIKVKVKGFWQEMLPFYYKHFRAKYWEYLTYVDNKGESQFWEFETSQEAFFELNKLTREFEKRGTFSVPDSIWNKSES